MSLIFKKIVFKISDLQRFMLLIVLYISVLKNIFRPLRKTRNERIFETQ
jgi:hypothetical protein